MCLATAYYPGTTKVYPYEDLNENATVLPTITPSTLKPFKDVSIFNIKSKYLVNLIQIDYEKKRLN